MLAPSSEQTSLPAKPDCWKAYFSRENNSEACPTTHYLPNQGQASPLFSSFKKQAERQRRDRTNAHAIKASWPKWRIHIKSGTIIIPGNMGAFCCPAPFLLMEPTRIYSVFSGQNLLKRGTAQTVAMAVKRAHENQRHADVAVFDDRTGRRLDVPISDNDATLAASIREAAMPTIPRAPGRPRLGVVAREVTLLPRQWAWLNEQEGGASVTLRRLVDNARSKADEETRDAQSAACLFMQDMLSDQETIEQANEALMNRDRARFTALTRDWPADLRDHVRLLAAPAFQAAR